MNLKKIALTGAAVGILALTGCSANSRTRSGERLSDRLNNAANGNYYSNDYGRTYGSGRVGDYYSDGVNESDSSIDNSYRNNGGWSNAASPTPRPRTSRIFRPFNNR
ncbi:MAG: hypothetical protein LBC41_04730 [Clostridiales bacterium]|jgi:hypothetical protein|nr:hypothetical protein [Clostridiales bacterium]